MKPAVKKTPIASDQTFELQHLVSQHFDPNWHFHSEYQLFVVLRGSGTRFVGDHVAPFNVGDVVLTGPELPHVWRSDSEYFVTGSSLVSEGIVVYFNHNFFGEGCLQKKEMFKVRQLFDRSEKGIEVLGRTSERIREQLIRLMHSSDFDSVMQFMSILNMLATTDSIRVLSSAGYSNSMRERDTERMTRVHDYVLNNFRDYISLQDVANIANMTPQSFCRYFKTHTNKTFSAFVSEIRIGHACKLLTDKKMNVEEICFDSGFNTISNFNRQFRAATKYSPLEYRKKYAVIG
jgi:AraC-like DNA-binding protein